MKPNQPAPAPALARAWNTWNTRSVLSHVLLPEALAINLSFCHYGLLTTVGDTAFGNRPLSATAGVKLAASEIATRVVRVTAGAHAHDGSYTCLTIALGEVTVRVESAHVGRADLVILVTPTPADLKPPALVVEGSFLWNQPGTFETPSAGVIVARSRGREHAIHCAGAEANDPYLAHRYPSCVFSLREPVAISSSQPRTTDEVAALITKARETEAASHARHGAAASRHSAAQACLAWNTVYEPKFGRVITTPSRQWNVDRLGYGIFCWDSFFMGWMFSPDSAEHGRACVREVLRERIDDEFVPNVVNGSGRRSGDRSQPCIGGISVLAMHEIAPDREFLREVWEPLLKWNRWWDRRRRNALGLISPGSDPYEPKIGDLAERLQPNTLRGAKLEAGPDNTPMYDDAPFDPVTHLMGLADVGLSSLYVLDCQALARIARELSLNAEAAELEQRAAAYADRLATLWNEAAGLFQNRRTDTGEFSPRLSPTCFYPLLTGIVTPAQASQMLDEHLLNEAEFWGEWVLPSVPRSDPAYPEQHYWRGRIWAPMNFLVYLGLKRAGCDAVASELARRSTRLFEKNWQERHGLFENYSAVSGVGGDVLLCDPMCAWTGLLVLMELMEAGTVPLPSLLRPDTSAARR